MSIGYPESKRSKHVTLIVILYFAFFSINQSVPFNLNSIVWIIGMSGYIFVFDLNRADIKRLSVIIFLYFSFILSVMYTKNNSLKELVFSFQYFGIFLLLKKYIMNFKLITYSFYVHAVFFIMHVIIGSNSNDIFKASRNLISVVMLIQTILLYVSALDNNKKIKIKPAIINLVICIWSVGRSGIIAAFTLLSGVLFFTSKTTGKKVFIVSCLLLALIVGLLALPIIIEEFPLIESSISYYSSIGLESGGRSEIVKEYYRIVCQDIRPLLLGVGINDNYTFQRYNSNLHNSYLRAHSVYGLLGFLIISMFIFNAFAKFVKCKNILYVMFLISLLARILTDNIAFFGILDPIVYYFIFNITTNQRQIEPAF